MKLITKYNINDTVWVINGRTGIVMQREIQGIKTQLLNGIQKTIYSFLKDKCDPNNNCHCTSQPYHEQQQASQ